MSKKIYLLQNLSNNEIICASEDKSFIQEVMCDEFINNVFYYWYWHQFISNYKIKDIVGLAQIVWEDTLAWFDENIIIQTVEVI